ncbi:uncharacterized protein LOC107268139 isoform X4 [Cephus cinctus]|uniref:Uncharacterized protein LOC107268139 isoform X4 n=1 Tax=Cephus cinctus TaxID=211228 RepID=A0AAJ7RIH0_CEPCN|nr:uncharacterized protein LOC107268139 isoform X4 [Cephus cinctus]
MRLLKIRRMVRISRNTKVLLQKICAACENFVSESSDCLCPSSSSSGNSSSALSSIRETVTRLIERLRESWTHGDELLEELRKFLEEVSYDGRVCLPQFEEAFRVWVAKISSRVNLQDGNNNVEINGSEGRCCRDIGSRRHQEGIVVMNRYAAVWYEDALSCGSTDASIRHNVAGNLKDSDDTEQESFQDSSSETSVDIGKKSSLAAAAIPPIGKYEFIEGGDTNSMELERSEFKYRQRVRKYEEENSALREELARVEESGEALRNRIALLSRQLERAEQRCKQLEKENDDQREILEANERREREYKIEIQRIEKERAAIAESLEKAETDRQSIPTVLAKLERITGEKSEYSRRLRKSQDKLREKEMECEVLQEKIAQLEKYDFNLQESYETTVRHLRRETRELQGQIAELQMERLNDCQCDGFSLTPPMGNVSAFVHATPRTVPRIEPESSLCAELQASGFFCEPRRNDSKCQELEEELNYYKNEIRQTLELFDKLMLELNCPALKGDSPKVIESETPDIQMLGQKASLLLEMATQLLRNQRELKDASVEVRLESSMGQRLDEFNIPTFKDRLQCIRSQQEEGQVRKYQGDSLPSRPSTLKEKLVGETILRHNSPTANVFCASEAIQASANTVDTIIGPIVAAIDEIIQGSPSASSEVDSPRGGERASVLDSRHRCSRYAYTLPPSKKRSLRDTNLSRADTSPTFPLERPDVIETLVSSRGDGCPTKRDQLRRGVTESITAGRHSISTGNFEPEELDPSLQNLGIKTESSKSSKSSKSSNSSGDEDEEAEFTSPRAGNPPAAKRKISVFHRSFELDAFKNKVLAKTMSSKSTTAVNSSLERLNMLTGNHQIQSHRLKIAETESTSSPSTFEHDTSSPEEESARFATESDRQQGPGFVSSPTKICISPFYEREMSLEKEGESENLLESIDSKNALRLPHLSSKEQNSEHSLDKISSSEVRSDEKDFPRILQKKKKENEGDRNEKRNSGGGGGGGGRKIESEEASAGPAVAFAMFSGEDSSDSESDSIVVSEKRRVHEQAAESSRFTETVEEAKLASSTPISNVTGFPTFGKIVSPMSPTSPTSPTLEKTESGKKESTGLKRERLSGLRRSLSESESVVRGSSRYCSRCISSDPLTGLDVTSGTYSNRAEERPIPIFPSLTDARLQESGIANLPDGDQFGATLSDEDLERKYTALSVGLGTDRVTLPKRMALSLRQRDQAEKNLGREVQKMHEDIQALAPLCIDRESVERVERVRHQLEMIGQCAHIVSCAAETLGAVHQEQRISRAVHLADRYLRVLRTRCQKLASELTETKRVLTENNIMVEESPSELGDDVPRLRYRSLPTTNRTMMTRRRASIATISRPPGTPLDQVAKEGTKQRNSVSGRMTMRRPSLSYDVQKWENNKLDRTDIAGELREIFEQAESRRNSLEENNNLVRSRSSNLSLGSCDSVDSDVWTISRDDLLPEIPAFENFPPASQLVSRRTSQVLRSIQARVQARIQIPIQSCLGSISIFWYILIFALFCGFCINLAKSSTSKCGETPLKWWSIQEILGQYVRVRQGAPRPI